MNKFIVLIGVLSGLLVFVLGMALNNITINLTGFVIVTITLFYKLIKDFVRKEKSAFDYIENKDEYILPLKVTVLKKRQVKISQIIIFIISLTVFLLAWNIITEKTIFTPSSPLYIESVINQGCTEMRPNGCKEDPSKIIVQYDVNRDGVIGGANDTLASLLEKQNCTDTCLKKRCSCPGY